MSKQIITIGGILYEVDTEDPKYKKRITLDRTLLGDAKQFVSSLLSPDFLKYFVPGMNTVAFALDAANTAESAVEKFKEGEIRKGFGDVSYTIGNILNGAVSLVPFSGLVLKEIHPGQFIFKHLPYKLIDFVNGKIKNFTRSGLFERSTDKAAVLLRINLIPDVNLSIPVNSQENAIDLLKSRYLYVYENSNNPEASSLFDNFDPAYGAFTLNATPVENNLARVKIQEYIPLKDIYHLNRSYMSPVESALSTIPKYITHNYSAGFARPNYIHINPYHLKSYKWNPNDAIAHELVHHLDTHPLMRSQSLEGFNFDHLVPSTLQYFKEFNNTELVARGSLIKNYFGLKDNTPITADMLKYAAKHYVPDTHMDNNMTEFFSGITDWNKAANWISKYSLKQGGKLNYLKFFN